jgi:alpha-beta hydrolase superfamily lysophospholipase
LARQSNYYSMPFSIQHHQNKLHGTSWTVDNAKANICLIHGFGEHIGRYQHVAEIFNAHGLNLFAIDLIGHGQSEGKRGDIPSFEAFLEEVNLLLKKAAETQPGLPTFLYGHSMGGCIVSKYVLSRNVEDLRGALITSPWLRLATPAPKVKAAAGKFLLKVGVNITENAGLEPDHLSRDLSVGQAYLADPLVHNKISARTFTETSESGEWVLEHADQNKIPLLIAHGDADQITDYAASEAFAKKAGELASFKSWPGARHETQNETNKKEVIQFYANWFLQQLGNQKS